MHFKFRNVNDAFKGLVAGIDQGYIPVVRQPSRVGEVLRVPEPVIVTYAKPQERVLFNAARDCNHFFHLFEVLWMLAGRNDVEPLAYYNPRMRDFSDDGETFHGAYGYRWRHFQFPKIGDDRIVPFLQSWRDCPGGIDQLHTIVESLKINPDCRRQVLSVWSAGEDLGNNNSLDLPCNTHAYFSIRQEWDDVGGRFLDMTVCNRSNDMIWGMFGANAVHWSVIQEYMAERIGVEVGAYNQFTNNLHVYTERWEPKKWLAEYETFTEEDEVRSQLKPPVVFWNGGKRGVYPKTYPLVMRLNDPERFDEECSRFVDSIDDTFNEPFLRDVAQPACAAFRAHKLRRYYGDNSALSIAGRIYADDWRLACVEWIRRRMKNWEKKNGMLSGSTSKVQGGSD